MKEKLKLGTEAEEGKKGVKFYIQRPPTLRIQPGNSDKAVKAHKDALYGHQEGELNFWMPFTDVHKTKTELWVEGEAGKADFEPLGTVEVGEVGVFHGTSKAHHVPPNKGDFTRVSIDFRIGVEGFFDQTWSMKGTSDEHTRRVIEM